MNNPEQQQPGLGGALQAVYGVVPQMREVRVSRSLGHFLFTALKQARQLAARSSGSKGRKSGGDDLPPG